MHLLENSFERKLLNDLPPNARDIAEEFLATKSLGDLLLLLKKDTPDTKTLEEKKVREHFWLPIIKAAILAKTTYLLPNQQLTREEILFLIKAICLSIDYPSQEIVLKDMIEYAKKKEMTTLNLWLSQFSKLLVEKSKEIA